MKKALSVVLSASMVLAMAAPAFAESATEAPDLDGSDFSVGLVTDVGGVNDGSFNQSAWEGLQKAGEDFGVTVNYLESIAGRCHEIRRRGESGSEIRYH